MPYVILLSTFKLPVKSTCWNEASLPFIKLFVLLKSAKVYDSVPFLKIICLFAETSNIKSSVPSRAIILWAYNFHFLSPGLSLWISELIFIILVNIKL